MATQLEADAALDANQRSLFDANPNLVKLSVVQTSRGDFVIEAGVISLEIQERASSRGSGYAVPSVLAVPPSVTPGSPSRSVEVQIVETGELRQLVLATNPDPDSIHPKSYRFDLPAQGGDSIGNCRYNSAGTFGCVVRLRGDNTNRYVLSNWHVLVGGAGRIGDPLLHPARLDGGVCPDNEIGNLHWHLLDSEFDAALGKVRVPWQDHVAHTFQCFGDFEPFPSSPTLNADVTKCGRTTSTTTGRIRSINSAVRVSGYPSGDRVFTNQIETTAMSRPGDSGSILFHSSGMQPVGLLFAGGTTVTIHNKLKVLFDRHFNGRRLIHVDDSVEEVPELQFYSIGSFIEF